MFNEYIRRWVGNAMNQQGVMCSTFFEKEWTLHITPWIDTANMNRVMEFNFSAHLPWSDILEAQRVGTDLSFYPEIKYAAFSSFMIVSRDVRVVAELALFRATKKDVREGHWNKELFYTDELLGRPSKTPYPEPVNAAMIFWQEILFHVLDPNPLYAHPRDFLIHPPLKEPSLCPPSPKPLKA